MKKYLALHRQLEAIFCICIFTSIAQAQTIKITTGTVLTNNGATITVSNTDLINDGNILTNSGVFVMTGNNNNVISGTGNTTFKSLQLNKTPGSKVLLQTNVIASGAVIFNSGLLDLGNNNLELKFPGGLLQNENETNRIISNGTGEVFIIQTLNAPSAVKPGNLGVIISSAQNLGLTHISRGFKEQVTATGDQSIKRYFTILPVNNINLNATLRINYLDAELNNVNESNLTIWQLKNSWNTVGVSTKSSNQNYVELMGIQELTQFTVGNPMISSEFQLSNFSGLCKGLEVRLQWKTANEGHIKQYIIEKSNDGANWQVATTVIVNPALQNAYSVPLNPGGAVHFRVKIEWVNGQFTFSDPIKVDCNKVKGSNGGGKPNSMTESNKSEIVSEANSIDNEIEVNVGPNPTTDQIRVNARLSHFSTVRFELRDMNGKMLVGKQWQMQAGWNYQSMSLAQYPAGTYMLILQGDLFKKSVMIIKK